MSVEAARILPMTTLKDGEVLDGEWDLYHLDDMLASQIPVNRLDPTYCLSSSVSVRGTFLAPGNHE